MSNQRSFPAANSLTVGVIGLGVMGRPMAASLLRSPAASWNVVISDRGRERYSELLDSGASWAESPRRLAEQADIIVDMLPDLPQLEQVLNGPDGIVSGITTPTLLVISSTSSASGIRELADRLATETNGLLHVVDAPVSGGEDGAVAGTLSIMVGGSADDVDLALPVLRAIGTPAHLGPLGAGAIAKFCNQLIVAANILALGEAAVLAERSGLDLGALFDLLENGYAGSRVLDSRKRRIVDADYRPSGVARYMIKDLRYALEEADRTGTDAAQLRLLLDTFTDLTAHGFGDQDIAVTRAYVESKNPPPVAVA
ncbi:NAD(P)-dependent oxidoreductase [Cryobacterium sp. MDB1-18-2]|uniref:NAD(P)-dependent oxidoreductase n=1 Tax=unclassified Cryobacterium TaxID=2649013 RepID=UPI00106D20B6|nr:MULTISPECIES: NAD(P)-dependent oxidoreductase [unclassified Cryobacterium]TFC35264.1 NAD(P)-dependent oxidoreductase [Cryobacterium sp. MDB1-18-2]TFC45044.1 NAD(P)-dependent oxidoreductase [Cryobacterium sp. MDB1-18-1]